MKIIRDKQERFASHISYRNLKLKKLCTFSSVSQKYFVKKKIQDYYLAELKMKNKEGSRKYFPILQLAIAILISK